MKIRKLMFFSILFIIVSCGIFKPETDYGNIEGFVLFGDLQPASNIEILVGRSQFGGFGHPGSWTTERRIDTNKNGFFTFKNIECKSWAVKIAPDDQILNEYDVEPISHIVAVKKNNTHKIEFILQQMQESK
ncbi:MAG: hypothetical protein WC155_07280 [Candidatus Cloacimonadales bacterium]